MIEILIALIVVGYMFNYYIDNRKKINKKVKKTKEIFGDD